MAIVLFLLYLALCIVAYLMFLKLFKVTYNSYYKVDEIIDSDGSTYTTFQPEPQFREYIKDYVAYTYDENYFLQINLTDKIEYISLNVICYSNKKIFKIINLLNEVDVKRDHYLIRLPDGCEEVKVNIDEVNGVAFHNKYFAQTKTLLKSIVASVMLAFFATCLLFIFRLMTANFNNNFFDWEYIYKNFYYEPYIYIIGLVFAFLLAIILFLTLYLGNKDIHKKTSYNKIRKYNINRIIRYRLKRKRKILCYVKFKFKKKFRYGKANVIAYDAEGNVIETYPLALNKKKKNYFLKGNTNIAKVKVEILSANFKKFYFNNGTFRKKITKRGLNSKFLTYKSVAKVKRYFLVSVLLISSFTVGKYYEFSNFNKDLSNFSYAYIDQNTKDSFMITGYEGSASNLMVPKSFNGTPITMITQEAFSEDLSIKNVYFNGQISIGQSAFRNCFNLRSVDFSNVDYIGGHAFGGTRINGIKISNSIEVESQAFYNCEFLENVIIENDAYAIIKNRAFEEAHIKYLEIHQENNQIDKGAFFDCTFDKCYVYVDNVFDNVSNNEYINSNSYTSYFTYDDNLKIENTCVHDNHSFFIDKNGNMKDEKSFTFIETIKESNCIENGLIKVRCNYCGQEYETGSASDPNKHEFVDGVCIHCGALDPNYN